MKKKILLMINLVWNFVVIVIAIPFLPQLR